MVSLYPAYVLPLYRVRNGSVYGSFGADRAGAGTNTGATGTWGAPGTAPVGIVHTCNGDSEALGAPAGQPEHPACANGLTTDGTTTDATGQEPAETSPGTVVAVVRTCIRTVF